MAPQVAWLTCCCPGARPLGQRALGLVLIFVTAVIWVAASFLSSMLVTTRPGAAGALHAPPFLLTYLATSVFTVFLPLVHGKRWAARCLARRCGGAGQRAWQGACARMAGRKLTCGMRCAACAGAGRRGWVAGSGPTTAEACQFAAPAIGHPNVHACQACEGARACGV